MSSSGKLRAVDGINYLDYSEFMGTTCGMVIKNDRLDEITAPKFILENIIKPENSVQALTLNQKHTNTVITPEFDLRKPADGIYTDSDKYVLIVRTADCLPVTLYDGRYIAVIHAGWRSLYTGIIREFFHGVPEFDAANARAIISPAIRECCFEVSPEVALLFDIKYRLEHDGGCYVDLKSLLLDELKEFGVKSILDNAVCTSCNNDMYNSYRREGKKVKQMFSYIFKGEY